MNLRGSEIGRCHHYLAIKALGLPIEQPPGYLLKIFEAGNRQEDETIAWLEKENIPLVSVHDRQREVVHKIGDHTITGHIDGIMLTQSIENVAEGSWSECKQELLEIKAMSQERFARLWGGQLEPAIAMQVAVYCLSLLHEDEEIDGFTILGKLWEKDQYHSYTLDGDEFTSWLDIQQQKIDKTVERVACFIDVINVRAKEYDSLQKGVALPGSPARDCKECGARYHCYPKLLEEDATILKGGE